MNTASSLMYACYSPQTASDTNIPFYYPILPESSQLQMPLGADSSLTIAQEQKFKIREISPEWGFANEFTKVIIIGSSISNPEDCSLACMFGDIEVPVGIIQDGVLCCQAPPCHSGKVTFCIISSNKEPCSEVRAFKYVDKHINPQQEDRKSSDELMLVVRLGQMLFSDSTMQKREGKDLQMGPHRRQEDHEDSWGLIMDAILTGSEPSCGIMDQVVEELMKDKLQQWISSRSLNGNDNLVCVLSKKEKEILHIIAGLGYEWALSSILASGVGVNFRDTNGWTALHWAARFGREKMVAALMAYGASSGAFTYPTEHDPTGKIPASIASACGHNGLAVYLSEQQAAARIQSFFRAHSFMKRQLIKFATSGSGMNEIQGLSEASKLVLRPLHGYNIAALSIQKNYRSLKGRRDYLSLRQKVVKIQAHIRGYQTRKIYKSCRDVGIYDKIVLRWRRRGAHLRGFNPNAMSINKEKEDEGILKSFRKRKVDVAIGGCSEVELGILANVMESTSQSDILTMDNDEMYLGQGKGALCSERSEIQKLVVKKETESPKLSSQDLPREMDEDTLSSDIIQNEMKDCCSIFFLLSTDYEFENGRRMHK